MALTTAKIQAAYVTFFNRPADVAGLNYWSTYKGSDVDLYNTFAASAEYTSLFSGMNHSATVNAIYTNLLGRSPDVAGLNYWVSQLDTGALSIGTIANAIKTGAQGTDATTVANKTSAATQFTTALDTPAEILGYASASVSSLATIKAWLAAVTTDATLAAQTAPAAMTSITTTAATGAASTGQTFTLTTGVDNVTGTSGNDTISAVFDEKAAQSTLQLADLVDGGAGRDTLSIRYTDSDGSGTATIKAATSPVFKNIEILELNPLVALTADLTGIAPALDTINILNPVGKATITAAPTAVKTVGISGVSADDADLSITFAAGLTGTADALTLNVSGASAATTATAAAYAAVNFTGAAAGDGLETINVVSSGSTANRLDSLTQTTATTLKTVNVEGAAAFRVNTALSNTVKTIDASKSTGGVNLGVAAGENVTFTGGTGNDRINMAAGLTADDKLNGGDGTDTLAISNAGVTSDKTAALNKAIEAQTSFEKLEFTSTATTQVGTSGAATLIQANGLTAIKEFVFTGAITAGAVGSAAGDAGLDAILASGFASANTNKIEIAASFVGGAGVAGGSGGSGVAGGAGGDALQVSPGTNSPADETTITLKGFDLTGGAGAKGDTGSGVGNGGNGGNGINAADFETINLVSTGATATAANNLAGAAGGASGGSGATAGTNGAGILINTNGIINVTGANDLTFTTQTVNPAAGGVQVKAASFTGKLVVTGTTGNDLITGGTNDDTITGGAGRDTIDLSAGGKDTVVLAITAAADRDTIKGFTAGADSDKLDIDLTLGATVLKAVTGTGTAFTLLDADAVTAFNFAATNNSANLAGGTDGTELLKGIANQGSTITSLTTDGATQAGYIVAYDGTNAYLYHYNDANNNNALVNTEIALIGVLENVATGTLVAGNFA